MSRTSSPFGTVDCRSKKCKICSPKKIWKNLGPPVSPANPETYKKIFCRGNSCSTFPVFEKSIYIYIYFGNIYAHEYWHTPKPLQNEEPTVSAMLPLQNQEPVLAHPCRHLGCPKKRFWRTSTESGTCHKSSRRFSLQNRGAQCPILFFLGALLWFSETLKPLQNEEPTVSAMLPLQNQEPVLAHPCRHLGCPKKWFWRTSTESGTCHKSSKRFSLQNKGAQSFFLVHFYDFQKH